MALDYRKEIDKQMHKKMKSLIKNEVIISVNKMKIKFKGEPSPKFYITYAQQIRTQEDEKINSLYFDKIGDYFDVDFMEKAQQFAERYQQNQLRQLVKKQIDQLFGDEFKSQLQQLLREIADDVMRTVPFN